MFRGIYFVTFLAVLMFIGYRGVRSIKTSSFRKKEELILKLDTPQTVQKMTPFPITITVVNSGQSKKVKLKNIKVKSMRAVRSRAMMDISLEPVGAHYNKWTSQCSKFESERDYDPLEARRSRDIAEKGLANVKVPIEPASFLTADKKSLLLNIEVDIEQEQNTKTYQISKVIEVQPAPEVPSVPPGAPRGHWYFGDTHSHSTYTWDYYFGNGIYTIPELKSLAIAAGLDWLVLTEHSYNLDPSIYQTIKQETTSISDRDFSFLYGEELSAKEFGSSGNLSNTCHFSGILNEDLIPSSTNIFRKASAPDSQQAIDSLKGAGGLAVINHPNWGTGLFEAWNFSKTTYDNTHGETGMEIMNGAWNNENLGSTTRWIDQRLLKGEKSYPFAGSDTESRNHFGECYTVVYAPSNHRYDIRASLSKGRHFVTTGPALAVWIKPQGSTTWHMMGDTVRIKPGQPVDIYVSHGWQASSMTIQISTGVAGQNKEKNHDSRSVEAGNGYYIIAAPLQPGQYVRATAICAKNKNQRAYTTPIWFE